MAASIFISYAHEDRARAEQLAARFAAAGWSAWWDRQITGGRHFDIAAEEAINAAKIVVVLWSRASVASHWVRAEAAWALARDKLLPVMIDPVDLPLQFFHVQTIDLAGRTLTRESPVLTQLLAELAQRLGGGPRARSLIAGVGQLRGPASRGPRDTDAPRGTNAVSRPGDPGRDPAPPPREAVAAGPTPWRPQRLPLALLGALLATLIIAGGYIVLIGESTPMAKPDPRPHAPWLSDTPHPPRQSAPTQDKNLPWFFKPP